MGRVRSAVACEHRQRVLRAIAAGSGAEGYVASIKDLAVAVGLAPSCARSSLQALVRAGHVRVVRRTYPDGGNAANAYFVTSSGVEKLSREQGGC